MNIRIATSRDQAAVKAVHIAAFPEDEGETVAQLAADLLAEKAAAETLSLAYEDDGSVVGHIAFSPVFLEDSDGFSGYILAPLGVSPQCQKGGVGKKLVEHGLRRLSEIGVNVVFVYGDPDYYGRFGFRADAASRYNAPYPLQYPFGWQALVLDEPAVAGSAVTISCVESLSDPGFW